VNPASSLGGQVPDEHCCIVGKNRSGWMTASSIKSRCLRSGGQRPLIPVIQLWPVRQERALRARAVPVVARPVVPSIRDRMDRWHWVNDEVSCFPLCDDLALFFAAGSSGGGIPNLVDGEGGLYEA